MRFFIPAAKDDEQAEEVLGQIRQFVDTGDGWNTNGRRFFKISYHHDGKDYVAEVGKPHPEDPHEVVVAILDTEGQCYYVCTTNRGVARGTPFLIGKHHTHSVEEFEPA